MDWKHRIDRALEENQFQLHAQSIVNIKKIDDCHLKNKNLYEVLIRMNNQSGKTISPRLFIPPAERYNQMRHVDRWVIKQTFSSLSSVVDGQQLFSINLSASSVTDKNLYAYINDQFNHYNISPSSICFELTETAVISSIQAVITLVQKLRKLGCYFSLDQFGCGLNSFQYLKNLSVDFVKIDGELIKHLTNNNIDQVIVKSINEIAHAIGLKTIAVCVENSETVKFLKTIHIDYAQGFFYDKPKPIQHYLCDEQRSGNDG